MLRIAFIFAVLFPYSLLSQSIIGESEVCLYECESYMIQTTGSGPFIWTVSGGYSNSDTGEEVTICWEEIGNQTIAVTDVSATPGSHLTTTTVSVIKQKDIEINFPLYPICESRDSIDDPTGQELPPITCKSVCGGSTVTYFVEPEAGVTYSWSVQGDDSHTIMDHQVTITWPATGAGSIDVSATNALGCESSIFHCIDIMEKPDAIIIADGTNICLGQSINFSSPTQDVIAYFWDGGNGSYDNGKNATFTYNAAGNYTASLVVQTECFCFDTSYYNIIVDANPGPEILCTGTVCVSDTMTYYAGDVCSSYDWSVSANGNIHEGGTSSDDYITIVWHSGPAGEVTLQTSGCPSAQCNVPTTEIIPIIDNSATIDGPTEICKGSLSVYTAPHFDGTQYNWTVSNQGNIISGHGTEQITVEWSSMSNGNTATIEVQYENCFLECGGYASLNVALKLPFDLSVNGTHCENTQSYFNTIQIWNPVDVDFRIYDPNNNLVLSEDNISYTNYDFTAGPGSYLITVQADPAVYCDAYKEYILEVVEAPTPPTEIFGNFVICPGETYTYSVNYPDDNYQISWVITDGNNNYYPYGSAVDVTWASQGPYEISVTVRQQGLGCVSDPYIVTVDKVESSAVIGNTLACLDTKEIYTVDGYDGDDIEWSIMPTDAGSLRRLVDGTLEVHWHESGTHTIQSDACGTSIALMVEVQSESAITVVHPEYICEGDLANVDITITAGATIVIKDENLDIISTLMNLDIPAGYYLIEQTDVNGCISIERFEIKNAIKPDVRISSPDNTGFCLPGGSATMHALNTIDGWTYQWYQDDIMIPNTGTSHQSSIYGFYYIIATNAEGCQDTSNVIELFEYCGPNIRCNGRCPRGPCVSDGIITFTGSSTGYCDEWAFTNQSTGYSAGTLKYVFDDPDAGVDSISILENPTHTFTNAGYYLVLLLGEVPDNDNPGINCLDWDYLDVVVPVSARFTHEEVCVGSEVSFFDKSTHLPTNSIATYDWDFGDPTSADNTSSLPSPKHIYDSPGTYTVTLIISADTGCLSRFVKTIEIQDGPTIDFNMPMVQCEDTAIPFNALLGASVIDLQWDFGDVASGASNQSNAATSLHTFNNSQIYQISLTATDIYGCESTITKPIDISTNTLNGDITLSPAIACPDEPVTLTAPSGAISYLWSNGSLDPSISVYDSKKYSVTVTDAGGCQYTPTPVNANYHNLLDYDIDAQEYSVGFNTIRHEESLEICEGNQFDLFINYDFNTQYEWSVGATTSTYLQYFNGLNTLGPGVHTVYVTATHNTTGCISQVPYQVTIHPRPTTPIISSNVADPCEGVARTLTISNYDPAITYYWSNGQQGESITVVSAGFYEVRGYSEFGCESNRAFYQISPLPDARVFTDGCQKACFPDTICLPANLGYSYEWIKDGIQLGTNSPSLEVIEAGDYQVNIYNSNGCSVTSNILSLEPKSQDHEVDGIVYLDHNENDVFDAGDEYIDGATVELLSGNTIIATTTTDVNGYYTFENIMDDNLSINVDVSTLGLDVFISQQSKDIDFSLCVEEKKENFPFNRQCAPQSTDLYLNTCPGMPIVYDTLIVMPGQSGDLVLQSSGGCDSVIVIYAVELAQPNVNFLVENTCGSVSFGAIDLSGNDPLLSFAVDDINTLSQNNYISNIAPGVHDLWIVDGNGCVQSLPFTVDQNVDPVLDITGSSTCINSNDGIANITVNDGENYSFSLDGSSYNSTTTFDQLPAGTHTIYIQNDDGCIWNQAITIDTYAEPQLNLETTDNCAGENNGSLYINIFTGSNLTFELDNGPVSSSQNFNSLATGMHTLQVTTDDGCIYPYSFMINESSVPPMAITTVSTCSGSSNGYASIIAPDTEPYQYSIDGIDYQMSGEFYNLAAGTYDIYIQDAQGCTSQESITINTAPDPVIVINTTDACPGIDDGEALVSSTESGLEYSLDGITFSNDPMVSNLPAGVYDMYIRGIDGCDHIFPFTILEAEPLEVLFTDPEMDCSVDNVTLMPEIQSIAGASSFAWSDGSASNSLSISESGSYEVTIEDKCSITSYEWNIDFTEEEKGSFYTPNIFSPNGDGINDEFLPAYADPSKIATYEMDIFDRWGNHIFNTKELDKGWDGLHKLKEGRSGVYVWMIRATGIFCDQPEAIELHGDVTIVR